MQDLQVLENLPDFMPITEEQKIFIWRFRFSLSKKKELLLKFLKAVDWQSETERKQAMDLLKSWSKIDMNQALPLLSGFFSLNGHYSHLRVDYSVNPEILTMFA